MVHIKISLVATVCKNVILIMESGKVISLYQGVDVP